MLKHSWLSGAFAFFCMAASAVQSAEAPKPADVRVLVDISGSMKETDPNNLRIPATNLLIELMPNSSQGSIWTFGRYVNMLVPAARVTPPWRNNAKEKAKTINSAGLYTNLVGALDKARSNISASSGFDHSIILLTDGRIDMREPGAPANIDAQERTRLFEQVLPHYIKANAKVHTVALSNAADKELLQKIAHDTNGLFLEAHTADDLLKVFLKAFDHSVPGEQVPLTDNRFVIDSSVKEFTALIFKAPGSKKQVQLISPDGDIFSAETSGELTPVRWHQDLNFDVVTVVAPQPGEWNIDADLDPNNRVQILSDLNLRVEGIPRTMVVGVPLEMTAAIVNDGAVVTDTNLLAITEISLEVQAPDGREGRKVISNPEMIPSSGIYSEEISRLADVGEYRFEITAASKTFQRQHVFTARLIEPIQFNSQSIFEKQEQLISAMPAKQVDVVNTVVNAHITYPDGSFIVLDLPYAAAKEGEQDATSAESLDSHEAWNLSLAPTKGNGEYVVTMRAIGSTKEGVKFSIGSNEYKITFPLVDPAAVVLSVSSQGSEASLSSEQVASLEALAQEPQADSAPEPQAVHNEPEELDLAKQFAEQEAKITQDHAAAEAESTSWWVYVLVGLSALAVLGGGAFAWIKRGSSNTSSDALGKDPSDTATSTAPLANARSVPEDLIKEDIKSNDLEDALPDSGLDDFPGFGDFDSYASEMEEEIPIPMPSEMAGDADMPVSLPDEFALDSDGSSMLDDPLADDDFVDDFEDALRDQDALKRKQEDLD